MGRSWPRWLGLLSLATLVWWGVSALDPDAQRVERVAAASLARASLGALSEHAGGHGPLEVGALDLRWSPACETGGADVLARAVREVPGAPGRLVVDCGRDHGHIRMALTLEGLGDGAPWLHAADTPVPTGVSLLPAILVVLVALFFRNVLTALFAAIVLGALLAEDLAIGPALERAATSYLWDSATDPFSLYIFGFTLALVGAVHVSIAMGGMQGVVDRLRRMARGVRSTQLATALMGLAVFFDDYANAVVVGSSARPLTDGQRISREKLAWIVDSTAAPVAGLAVISTWIGVEIQLFEQQLPYLGGQATSGYDLFLQVLPYRFYCLFALALVFIVVLTGRDFGPMLEAERRARGGRVAPVEARGLSGRRLSETAAKPGARPRAVNALAPILLVLVGTFAAFITIGAGRLEADGRVLSLLSPADLGDAFIAVGDDNVAVLFWAAVAGSVLSIALALVQRLLTLREALVAWLHGARTMLVAVAILILASGIRKVTEDLGAASFMVALMGDVEAWTLPVVTFLVAAAVAFSTGTSWGTMGILLPVAIPLAAAVTAEQGGAPIVLLLVAASVLDGAIFGDHCSVISDTTVMSSTACHCDHVAHVRTQIPYALLAMVAAAGAGYLLAPQLGGGLAVLGCHAAGLAAMLLFVRVRGRIARAEASPAATPAAGGVPASKAAAAREP